jgi:uncharacterized protein
MEVLLAALIALAISAGAMSAFVAGNGDLSVAATVFCGVFVQALPFLVLGVVVSGLIAAYVSADRLARWLPGRPAGGGRRGGRRGRCGAAGLRVRVGARRPSPVRRRWFARRHGADVHAVRTCNQSRRAGGHRGRIPGSAGDGARPLCGLARHGGGNGTHLAALLPGRVGDAAAANAARQRCIPVEVFTEAAWHDFLHAGSYLVLGAAAAAALRVVVPAWVFEHLAGHLVVGVLTMALFAVVLALRSEADAFVAASLTMLPLPPQLLFLVVGPAVDVKLSAMQAGLFGRQFAIRFGPATFTVATVVATVVGLIVLAGAR